MTKKIESSIIKIKVNFSYLLPSNPPSPYLNYGFINIGILYARGNIFVRKCGNIASLITLMKLKWFGTLYRGYELIDIL